MINLASIFFRFSIMPCLRALNKDYLSKRKKKGMTSEINKHKDTFKYTYF